MGEIKIPNGTTSPSVASGRGDVALMIGGSSGIGLALSEHFARDGLRVVIAGRNPERLRQAQAALAAKGLRVDAVAIDVTDANAVAAAVAAIAERYGRIDIVTNNAGLGVAGDVRDMQMADWHRILDANLNGVVHVMSAIVPLMIRQGKGQITNTSSLAGLVPMPGMVPYVAAKHAVVGLSLAARLELSAHGIRVNVVCPAGVQTPMTDSIESIGMDSEFLKGAAPLPPMAAMACARAIAKGMRRDDAIIVPGPAAAISFLHRCARPVTRAMGRSFLRVLTEARTRYLARAPHAA